MKQQWHKPNLRTKQTDGAQVDKRPDGIWHLEIPSGGDHDYRLAQLDDYGHHHRRDFPWCVPSLLRLRARASAQNIPGTWGFGFWNDPFSLGLIQGVEALRLPALPNAAWFFIASDPNYLSLRDDLPASGPLAATFNSPRIPTALLALGAPLAAALLIPSATRRLRKLLSWFVRQGTTHLNIDLTAWHTYEIDWRRKGTALRVDGQTILERAPSPQGPLGLVLWIDNQYASFSPKGKFKAGSLANDTPAWIELDEIQVS